MESHVPAIQEQLRRSGFPGFEQAVEHQFEFSPAAAPKLTTQNRWLFRRVDATQVVVLSTSSLILQVTEYSQFEDFVEAFEPTIATLADIVAPAYHERIGVRYINAVENAGTRMTELFRETVLSFTAEELGVESLLTAQQVVGKTPRGQIVVRMNQVEDAPLLPPDLINIAIPRLARPRDGVHAILDIDGADTTPGEFAFAPIEERLWEIHNYTERAFWQSTTDVAHKEWGLITASQGDSD
jgi:uncharacterized protein (TIGR04255 family)